MKRCTKIIDMRSWKEVGQRRLTRIEVAGVTGIRFGSLDIFAVAEDDKLPETDARVFEEDTCLVLSADPHIPDINEDIDRIKAQLEHHRPYEPGTVVVGGRYPLRMYAIVHDLDQEPSWKEEWVENALEHLFYETGRRGIRSVALPMIGTRHGSLPAQRFVALLGHSLRRTAPKHPVQLWVLVPPKCDYPVLDGLSSQLEARDTF